MLRKVVLCLVFVVFFLFSLVFPSIQATAPVQSNENPTDGSQLTTELTQLCIDINDSDGDNMYWEIWQGGNLLENGTPFSYPTHTYTFNNCTTPHHAYWSSDDVPLKMTGDVEFSCSNYTNVSAVDSLNVTTNAASKDYTHHHFLFNISEDPSTITNVDVNWHGYAGAFMGGAKPKWYWDATMYFNTDAPGWYTATSTTLYTTDDPHEEWLNYTLHHDINDWLDDNGILELAIQNTYAGNPSIVHTDYIEVVVTYKIGGDPAGTYCTNNVSWWNNNTCEQWWYWDALVYDGTSTTYGNYTFQNMPCVIKPDINPPDGSVGICPCCDAMCVSIGTLYDKVNLTIYRRGEYEASFYMVENYTNISNRTYCFCIDGHIEGGMYRPMRYNTTYYWYAYAEDYYNNSMNVTSSTWEFTTAEDIEDCSCGGIGELVVVRRHDLVLFLMVCSVALIAALLAHYRKT